MLNFTLSFTSRRHWKVVFRRNGNVPNSEREIAHGKSFALYPSQSHPHSIPKSYLNCDGGPYIRTKFEFDSNLKPEFKRQIWNTRVDGKHWSPTAHIKLLRTQLECWVDVSMRINLLTVSSVVKYPSFEALSEKIHPVEKLSQSNLGISRLTRGSVLCARLHSDGGGPHLAFQNEKKRNKLMRKSV